jgi:CsoR family transcriptional regulator, copper-sensing transcriptional repressor
MSSLGQTAMKNASGLIGTGKTMTEIDKSVGTRLRRIEGQVQGLQRMLDSGRDCEEALTQIMAVRSSLDQVGLILMEHHIEHCLLGGLPDDSPVAKDVSDVLKSWARFGLIPGARSDLT